MLDHVYKVNLANRGVVEDNQGSNHCLIDLSLFLYDYPKVLLLSCDAACSHPMSGKLRQGSY